MEGVEVTFKIEGPVFKNGVPLYETIHSLQEYHGIIDKAYLSLAGINKMSSTIRNRYAIIGSNFKRGSFESELMIWAAETATTVAPLFPVFQSINSGNIWEVAKASFEYLKALAEIRREGREPTVTIHGDVNAPIVIINGNNICTHQIIVNAATKAEPHIKNLSSMIEEGKIDYIFSRDRSGQGIYLSHNEKNLFNPKTKIDTTAVSIKCNIYRFDKEAQVGKLRVFLNQEIPSGEYTFKPMTSSTIGFIHAMAESVTEVDVFKEIEIHTSGVERIAKLHVISFTGQRSPTLFDER